MMTLHPAPGVDIAASIEEQRTGQGRWGPYKTATDLARYCELIGQLKPRTLIETGSWNGESARWFAELVPEVISIDHHNRGRIEYTARGSVLYVRQDSAQGPARTTDVRAPCMVVLDSDHRADHVYRELHAWAPFVTVGSYLVVEDTITGWIPDYIHLRGGPPHAIDRWMAEGHPYRFEPDVDIEARWPTTQHPGGWLRRVA